MVEEQKTLKQYCKEAKKRLKSGFWRDYCDNLKNEMDKAEKVGISASKVKEYYTQKVTEDIRSAKESDDGFYLRVKKILDEEGEISGVLGRLTDREVYDHLSYEEKQRYNLVLSERYLKAVARYNAEKEISTDC